MNASLPNAPRRLNVRALKAKAPVRAPEKAPVALTPGSRRRAAVPKRALHPPAEHMLQGSGRVPDLPADPATRVAFYFFAAALAAALLYLLLLPLLI